MPPVSCALEGELLEQSASALVRLEDSMSFGLYIVGFIVLVSCFLNLLTDITISCILETCRVQLQPNLS